MNASKVEETSSEAWVIGCSSDLLPEILIHLPARTLLRFKFVCKQWMVLISDPQFAIKHARITHLKADSLAPSGLFLTCSIWNRGYKTVSLPLFGNPVPLLSFQDQSLADRIRDIRSCKGLLLCLLDTLNQRFDAESCCVVCNPTTGDFKVLPTPRELEANSWLDGLTLVFNPSESHHYKVVGIKRFGYSRAGELHIYSSETNCWKFCCFVDGLEFKPHVGVSSNDIVYWIGRKHMHYYKVNSAEFGSLDMPGDVYAYFCRFAAESCGRLYLAVDLQNSKYKVFEFDNRSMKWSCPHEELLDSDDFGNNNVPHHTSLLGVGKRKEDGDLVLLFITFRRLIISKLALPSQVEGWAFKACEYIPSLVPV